MRELSPTALLIELRNRFIMATGCEPKEVFANVRFRDDFMADMQGGWVACKLEPSISADEFDFCGMRVKSIIRTDVTTLIAKYDHYDY